MFHMTIDGWDVIYSEWFRCVWSCLSDRMYRLDDLSSSFLDLDFGFCQSFNVQVRIDEGCLCFQDLKSFLCSAWAIMSASQEEAEILAIVLHSLKQSSPSDRFIVQVCQCSITSLISLLYHFLHCLQSSLLSLSLHSEYMLSPFLCQQTLIFCSCPKCIYVVLESTFCLSC